MIDVAHRKRKYASLALLLALLVFCAAVMPSLQNRIGEQKTRLTEKKTMFYLPSLPFLKIFSMGFERLIADFFWIKAVTYTESDALDKLFVLNDHEMHEYLEEQPVSKMARYRVYQMLTAATDFDPEFLFAYEFGGTILSWGGQVELANDLLLRGFNRNRDNPQAWKLAQTLAFNLFFFKKNYMSAAHYMKEVSRLTHGKRRAPDAIVTLYLASHRYEMAINMLEQLRKQAPDPDTRAYYDEKIKYATVERDLNYLNTALHVFINRYGVMPIELDGLVTLKIIPSVPAEPFGGKYVINTADKKIENDPYRRHRVIASLEEDAANSEAALKAKTTSPINEAKHADHEGHPH